MLMVDEDTPLAITELVPVMTEKAANTGPGAKVTVPPTIEFGVTIDKIFVSAVVDFRLQLDTPEALVEMQGP